MSDQRTFIAEGDFTDDARVSLPAERLDILIASVVTILSQGITTDARLSRKATLERGSTSGTDYAPPPQQWMLQ